ncbi:MAG: PilZ domain-containing protein [Candidatus Angelobacter sp.]
MVGISSKKRNLGANVDQSIERRNSRRFQIALPLLLRWNDRTDHYDAGHCINIGNGGMFVIAAKTPPLGMEVEVEFVLPAFGAVTRSTRLHCVGRVSRLESCCQLTGFAVAGRFVNGFKANQIGNESVGESLDAGN